MSPVRSVAAEVCKELFTPFPPHDDLALNGVEVFMNASASIHQVGKALDFRFRALIGVTRSLGGVYMYSNQRGCDGGRLYYGTHYTELCLLFEMKSFL